MRDTHRPTGEGSVTMQAGTAVLHLLAEKYQGLLVPLGTGRGLHQILPWSLQSKHDPTGTLTSVSQPPEL